MNLSRMIRTPFRTGLSFKQGGLVEKMIFRRPQFTQFQHINSSVAPELALGQESVGSLNPLQRLTEMVSSAKKQLFRKENQDNFKLFDS